MQIAFTLSECPAEEVDAKVAHACQPFPPSVGPAVVARFVIPTTNGSVTPPPVATNPGGQLATGW